MTPNKKAIVRAFEHVDSASSLLRGAILDRTDRQATAAAQAKAELEAALAELEGVAA